MFIQKLFLFERRFCSPVQKKDILFKKTRLILKWLWICGEGDKLLLPLDFLLDIKELLYGTSSIICLLRLNRPSCTYFIHKIYCLSLFLRDSCNIANSGYNFSWGIPSELFYSKLSSLIWNKYVYSQFRVGFYFIVILQCKFQVILD